MKSIVAVILWNDIKWTSKNKLHIFAWKKKLAFFFCWFLSELIFRLILDDLPRTKSKALSSLLKSAVAAADFQLNIYVWDCCCLSYYYSIPSRISISKKRDRWSSFDPALCQSFFSHGSTGSQYGNTMVFSQEEQLLARSFALLM